MWDDPGKVGRKEIFRVVPEGSAGLAQEERKHRTPGNASF